MTLMNNIVEGRLGQRKNGTKFLQSHTFGGLLIHAWVTIHADYTALKIGFLGDVKSDVTIMPLTIPGLMFKGSSEIYIPDNAMQRPHRQVSRPLIEDNTHSTSDKFHFKYYATASLWSLTICYSSYLCIGCTNKRIATAATWNSTNILFPLLKTHKCYHTCTHYLT